MHSVNFKYSFSSPLGILAHARFINEITVDIELTDDYGRVTENIGMVDILIVNIDEAAESEYSLFEVLDAHSEYLARHAFEIFDPEEGDYSEPLNVHYQFELSNRNFCLIEKITILPKYRGFNIGAKVIRDIIFHFGAACGLFAIQPFPLQFEAVNDGRYDNLELNSFERALAKARRRLANYYKNIGFEPVKGIKDLLFYNPALVNKKITAIDLEDSDIFKLKILK